MKRKHLAAFPIAATIALVGCSADPPAAPTVTATPPTVTETVTAPPPPPVTVTPKPAPEKSKPVPRPTEDAKYIGCVDQGMNTADWDTAADTPSRRELELAGSDPVTQPSVDAPLVQVAAWSGPCFDTVEFVIDTTMNEVEHTDLPWFDVRYVDRVTTDGEGAHVPLLGNADLQVTMFVKGASFVHSSGHVPPGMVNVYDYHRHTDNFEALQEIVGTGDFENVVNFGLGVDQKRPFAAYFHQRGDGTTSVVVRIAN